MDRIITANLFAGLVPGLAAPIVWPVIALLYEGSWPQWSIYPMAAAAIAMLAIVIGLSSCLTIGIIGLVTLNKFNRNTPRIASVSGFIVGMLIYFPIASFNDYPSITEAWPLALFFSTMGAICGAVASRLSRQQHSQPVKN